MGRAPRQAAAGRDPRQARGRSADERGRAVNLKNQTRAARRFRAAPFFAAAGLRRDEDAGAPAPFPESSGAREKAALLAFPRLAQTASARGNPRAGASLRFAIRT